MKRVRALLAALVTACGLLLGAAEILAANQGKLESVQENTTVREGQEVALRFSLEEILGISGEINALKGTLEADSAIFEAVFQEDFETENSWEKLFFNPENGEFVLINRPGSSGGESVFRLGLTVRSSAPAGEIPVALTELVVSDGIGDQVLPDVSVTLSVIFEDDIQSPENGDSGGNGAGDGEEEPGQPGQAGDGEEEPGQAGGSEEEPGQTEPAGGSQPEKSGSVQGNGESGEENRTGGRVDTGGPLSGFIYGAGVVLGIVMLAGSAFFLRKHRKLSRGTKILTGVVVFSGAVLLAAGSAYAFAGKGDLNGDGTGDYTDVELLERHLIGLELLPENRKDAADMNSDGRLTVTDLSLLIRRIERTLEYEVELSSAMERFYYEKGEQVELKFLADVSYGVQIEKVTVDGLECDVKRDEESSVYTVGLEAGEASGVKEFHITEVLLET